MKCNFIGIGVQKSASTWVYRILEDHPQVKVSDPKELDFFSMNYDKGIAWYESHFNLEKDGVISVGEISPSYFNSREAVIRAQKYNPDLKLVVTLRDPVARAYSNHLHLIRINQYSGRDLSFEAGLESHEMYLEQSKYYSHLKYWFDYFPRTHILVLIQENILINPKKTAKQVYEFLGVNNQHQSRYLTCKANVSYVEKYKGFDGALRTMAFGFRKIGLSSLIQKIRNRSFIIKLREKNRVHLNSIVPKIMPETELYLMNQLETEILNLADLLQVDSFPWKTWKHIEMKKADN